MKIYSLLTVQDAPRGARTPLKPGAGASHQKYFEEALLREGFEEAFCTFSEMRVALFEHKLTAMLVRLLEPPAR